MPITTTDKFLSLTTGDAVDLSQDPENKPGNAMCLGLWSNLLFKPFCGQLGRFYGSWEEK